MKRSALLKAALGVLAVLCGTAGAQIPPEERTAIVDYVLKNFWGNAIDSSGRPIQPSSETERGTVPVDRSWTSLAIDIGEVSGRLQWCRLDSIVTMRALTARARRQGLSDKQVAFVTMVHGMTQGTVVRQRQAQACDQSVAADAVQRSNAAVERLAQ